MTVATSSLPHHLELVVDFVNTRDVEAGTDDLSSAQALLHWLVGRGLINDGSRVTSRDLDAAITLREGLRAILISHNGATTIPADAVAVLDEVARRGQLAVRFGQRAAFVTLAPPHDRIDGALSRLLTPIALAALDGSWERVKACAAEDCQWAFYDRSRNHSGRWCDMAACGNRTKVRRYRGRTQHD